MTASWCETLVGAASAGMVTVTEKSPVPFAGPKVVVLDFWAPVAVKYVTVTKTVSLSQFPPFVGVVPVTFTVWPGSWDVGVTVMW
jgi:hypothetical protein